jgi:hypothetical protein
VLFLVLGNQSKTEITPFVSFSISTFLSSDGVRSPVIYLRIVSVEHPPISLHVSSGPLSSRRVFTFCLASKFSINASIDFSEFIALHHNGEFWSSIIFTDMVLAFQPMWCIY